FLSSDEIADRNGSVAMPRGASGPGRRESASASLAPSPHAQRLGDRADLRRRYGDAFFGQFGHHVARTESLAEASNRLPNLLGLADAARCLTAGRFAAAASFFGRSIFGTAILDLAC